MKACRKTQRRIWARLDDGLSFEEELALEQHLARCERCRVLERRAALLEEALAVLPEPPSEQMDVERAVEAVRARVASSEPIRSERRVPWRRLIAAAALVLALLLAWIARSAKPASVEREAGREPAIATEIETGAEIEQPLAPFEASGSTTNIALPPEARIDPARLERAREEVRMLLVEASAGLDPAATSAEAEAFAARFERMTRHVVALGWPRERLVTSCIAGEDARAARAALRYLGARAAAGSAASIAGALERADRKRSAVRALGDLGAAGAGELVRALADRELFELALRELAALGGEAAARAIERQVGELGRDDELLLALAGLGAPAVEPLVRLALEGRIDAERLRATLERTRGAGEELARLLELEAPGARALALAEAAAAVDPQASLPAIEALCLDRATRERAALCLGSIRHADAVSALMRLRDSGRLSAAYLEPAVLLSLERNASILAEMAALAIDEGDLARQEELVDFLVSSEGSGASPALIVLAGSSALDLELRQAAAVAAGELGTRADLPALRELFARLGPDERRIAAAALSALHELGGDGEANAALADASVRELQDLLTLLRRRRAKGRTTVSIFQLARALEPVLEARAERERSTSS